MLLSKGRGGIGSVDAISPDEAEEEEEEEELSIEDDGRHEQPSTARADSDPSRPQKTDKQQAMEAEWGLYRSPMLSQKSEEEEDPETDDEHKRDSPDVDEEEFMVGLLCASLLRTDSAARRG